MRVATSRRSGRGAHSARLARGGFEPRMVATVIVGLLRSRCGRERLASAAQRWGQHWKVHVRGRSGYSGVTGLRIRYTHTRPRDSWALKGGSVTASDLITSRFSRHPTPDDVIGGSALPG